MLDTQNRASCRFRISNWCTVWLMFIILFWRVAMSSAIDFSSDNNRSNMKLQKVQMSACRLFSLETMKWNKWRTKNKKTKAKTTTIDYKCAHAARTRTRASIASAMSHVAHVAMRISYRRTHSQTPLLGTELLRRNPSALARSALPYTNIPQKTHIVFHCYSQALSTHLK